MAFLLIGVAAIVPVSKSAPRCVVIGSSFLVSCDADARPSNVAENAQAARALDFLSAPIRN
jgi:hypothetical protein